MAKIQKPVTALMKGALIDECLDDSAVDVGTEGLEYTANNDNKTCSVATYKGIDTNVIIPREVIITIEDGNKKQYFVTSIGEKLFDGIIELTSIKIPVSITSIGFRAFDGCTGLTTVYYEGTETEWDEISIDINGNNALSMEKVYFYSETQPTEEGNYWHYINGVPIVWGEEVEMTIDGFSYSFIKGMTWKNWCDSGYNTLDLKIDTETNHIVNSAKEVLCIGTPVSPGALINENGIYTLE